MNEEYAIEDYEMIRKLNQIEYTMKLILNRLPEEETIEDLVIRLLKDHGKSLEKKAK